MSSRTYEDGYRAGLADAANACDDIAATFDGAGKRKLWHGACACADAIDAMAVRYDAEPPGRPLQPDDVVRCVTDHGAVKRGEIGVVKQVIGDSAAVLWRQAFQLGALSAVERA